MIYLVVLYTPRKRMKILIIECIYIGSKGLVYRIKNTF